jgi:hypothetical protein
LRSLQVGACRTSPDRRRERLAVLPAATGAHDRFFPSATGRIVAGFGSVRTGLQRSSSAGRCAAPAREEEDDEAPRRRS